MVNHPNRKAKAKEQAILVTTAHRGVFFGYTGKSPEAIIETKTVSLRAARNCIYWPSSQRGFIGLASEGPHAEAKIGPSADLTLGDVTSVAICTNAAVKAWELAPWNR